MATRRTARDKLEAFLQRHPAAATTHNLTDLARIAGVSPQRVAQLFPDYPRDPRRIGKRERKRGALASRLKRFLKAHPDALKRPADGGLTYKVIAAQLGARPTEIGAAWRALKLTERTPQALTREERDRRYYVKHRAERLAQNRAWRQQNRERSREIQREANRRYRAKQRKERGHDRRARRPSETGANRPARAGRGQPPPDQRHRA